MKFTLILLSLLITIVSFAAYRSWGEFWFARGSNSTLLIAKPSIWVMGAICAALLLDIGLLVLRPESRLLALGLLPILVAVWILSGRALGVYPDGRVIVGWFFYPTSTIDLRDSQEDYEAHIAHTQVRVSSGWTMVFSAHGKRRNVFVGPILFNSAVAMLRARGFSVICGQDMPEGRIEQ